MKEINKNIKKFMVAEKLRNFERYKCRPNMRDKIKAHSFQNVNFDVNCFPFLAIRKC